MTVEHRKFYLPRCVSKKDLKNYFGVGYKKLWNSILTEDLLNEWGYSYPEIKKVRVLIPDLTLKIYIHFGITNLLRPVLEDLKEMQASSN